MIIDRARSNDAEGKVILDIKVDDGVMACWIDWVYGQPVTTSEHGAGILIKIVNLYNLAHGFDDYECVNFCLDAIREFLSEQSECLKGTQWLQELHPVLETCCEEATRMLVDTLAYGPWAESGELEQWLDDVNGDCGGSAEIWVRFFCRLCRAQAARLKAQISGKFEQLPCSQRRREALLRPRAASSASRAHLEECQSAREA